MPEQLPTDGYLSLPLRMIGGRLQICDLDESIRRWLQLNLNVPEQGKDRPVWMPADPRVGCRVPHFDFQAVTRTLGSDTARLTAAIKRTAELEPRIESVSVHISEVPAGDAARRRRNGSIFRGLMKRVTIDCRRIDGKLQSLHYDVAFGGSGPVFPEDD